MNSADNVNPVKEYQTLIKEGKTLYRCNGTCNERKIPWGCRDEWQMEQHVEWKHKKSKVAEIPQ